MTAAEAEKNTFVFFVIITIGGIALAAQSISPISKHYFVAWSVCHSVCQNGAPCLNRLTES